MGVGNGNGDDTPSHAYRRKGEYLSNGEDVSLFDDRELLVRVANGQLAVAYDLGRVLGAVSRIETRVGVIEARLVPGGEMDMRARAESGHAMEDFAEKVVEAVHDEREGRGNITAERVREIVDQTNAASIVARAQKASDSRRRIVEGIVIGVVVALGAAFAGHYEGRASAPQAAPAQTK